MAGGRTTPSTGANPMVSLTKVSLPAMASSRPGSVSIAVVLGAIRHTAGAHAEGEA
jgi:hypothetical protein